MSTRTKWACIATSAALVAAVGVYALWRSLTRSESGVMLLSGSSLLLPSGTLVDNLSSGDPDVARESLAVLADRRDPAGVKAAVPLLKSPDPYVWFNAALYLGAMRRQEAVPYLIKGLRHRAWRARPDCATHLSALTGQNFGADFEKWRGWWEKTNPGTGFNFDDYLGD